MTLEILAILWFSSAVKKCPLSNTGSWVLEFPDQLSDGMKIVKKEDKSLDILYSFNYRAWTLIIKF